jgi:tetratricopeptide (TPR) repeat protein
LLHVLGTAYKSAGRFDEGRELLGQAEALGREFGHLWSITGTLQNRGALELVAGNPAAAEGALREACELLIELGDKTVLPMMYLGLAHAVCEQGRYDEADELIQAAEGVAAEHKETSLFNSVGDPELVRAIVLMRRGRLTDAEPLARKAVELAGNKGWILFEGETRLVLADVLLRAGRREEGERVFAEAIERFERKGALAYVWKAQRLRESLEPAAAG